MDIGKTIPKHQVDYKNKNDLVSLLSVTQPHQYNNLRTISTGRDKWDLLGNHSIV